MIEFFTPHAKLSPMHLSPLLWLPLIIIAACVQGIVFLPGVNADDLYALAFVSDLISGTAPVRWYITPADGFFPDLLIVTAGYLLGFDQAANFLFFVVVYHLLLFASIMFFLRSCDLDRSTSGLVAAVTSLLVAFVDPNHSALARLLAYPAMHNGVLPIALFIFGIITQEIKRPQVRSRAILLFALTALIVMSDFVAIVQIVAPVIFVLGVLAWQRPSERVRYMIVTVAGGALAGWAMRYSINMLPQIKHGTTGMKFSNSIHALVFYVHSFPSIVGEAIGWLRGGLFLTGLGAGFVVTARWLTGRDDHAIPLLTLSAIAALLGPLLAGTFIDPALLRQQIPAYALPIVIVVWLVAAKFPVTRPYLAAAAFLLAGSIIAKLIISNNDGYSNYLRAHRDTLEGLKDVDFVMAEYWDAKPLYLASDRKLPVCGTVDDGGVYPWITNLGWCVKGLEAWNARKGSMAIGGQRISTEKVIRKYGHPDRTVRVAERDFLIYGWTLERANKLHNAIPRE